ncbi:MAG: ParA family protein [Gammaproteobacteria bacterium]|nr:ParA family protein [Gammaproteobacteria bacterium]
MKVLAVVNQKGGVGKTTTAVSMAGILVQRKHRVLLVDADPHGSLTSYFHLDHRGFERSVYSLFDGYKSRVDFLVSKTQIAGLHVIASSPALATLDKKLGGQDGKGLILGQALQQLSDWYDYAIIDCPPVLGVLMVNAMAASDKLVIPVQAEFLALKGLDLMVQTVAMVSRALAKDLDYMIVPTMYDRRTRSSGQCLELIRGKYPRKLWDGVIPVDAQFKEASSVGVPISTLSRTARGTMAYELLVDSLRFEQVLSHRQETAA